jgi:hypothetical protein
MCLLVVMFSRVVFLSACMYSKCARHNFPYIRGWMQMVLYYQMIYFPETNNTIKRDSCYGYKYITIIQCTITLTLCINVSCWCGEAVSCVLSHSAASILLHCLRLTARLFPLLADQAPRLPRWLPFPQDPHISLPHCPLHQRSVSV